MRVDAEYACLESLLHPREQERDEKRWGLEAGGRPHGHVEVLGVGEDHKCVKDSLLPSVAQLDLKEELGAQPLDFDLYPNFMRAEGRSLSGVVARKRGRAGVRERRGRRVELRAQGVVDFGSVTVSSLNASVELSSKSLGLWGLVERKAGTEGIAAHGPISL